MIWLLSAAVFGLTLGFSFAATVYVLTRVEWLLVCRKPDPDAVHFADQTNVVHADFRPTRWPLSPEDAA